MGRRKYNYTRAGVLTLDEVMPLIKDPAIKTHVFHGHQVNLSSLRLRNFAKSHTCSGCGLVATHFAVENNNDFNWHINLWAERPGKSEMLFTHDHTLARSLGGTDDEANTTTMCSKCNNRKAIGEYAEYCKLKGLPPPGTKTSTKVKVPGPHDKNALMQIAMELAVRQFRKRQANAAA